MHFHLEILSSLTYTVATVCSSNIYSPGTTNIISAAHRDGIDLPSLPFASAAFASIESIQNPVKLSINLDSSNRARLDTHVHVVPDWYHALVPLSGMNPTPNWTVKAHLEFMAANDIGHDVVSISTPGSGVYLGDSKSSVGLARLLNEVNVLEDAVLVATDMCLIFANAKLVRTYPKAFSFYATAPLPYVEAAEKEITYARDHLGALGTVLMSNHEGKYLGDTSLTPFFEYLNARGHEQEVVFVHPTNPVEKINGAFVSANPTLVNSGFVEFYFETARTILSLALAQTLQNYTNIRWHFPHAGGAWPSIEDRILNNYPAIEGRAKDIFNTRVWYDNAGAVFPYQVQGLLGYGVPASQLVFGTDYPYLPAASYGASINSTLGANAITAQQKECLFHENPKTLHLGAI